MRYLKTVESSILSLLAPLLGSSLPYWSTGLITQFLDLSQAVGLPGRIIISSQGLYVNTEQHKHRKIRTHVKHPCPRRDSNRNHGLRAIEDCCCLRMFGYRDRQSSIRLHHTEREHGKLKVPSVQSMTE
jgi:hypothetical protein